MKKLILIISLILGIIAAPVFAEEEKSVLIDTFPTNHSVSVGNTFGVNVAVGSDYSNTTFYYIFYGGPDENLDVIETKSQDFSTNINFTDDNLNCHNLPTFTVDEIGNGYLRSNYAYIPPNYPSGIYSLYVSFFFPDCSNINTLISFPRSISVIGVDPTPSLVPTPTPTPTNTFPPTPSLAAISTPNPTPTPSPPFNSTPTTPTSATTFQQSIPTKIPTPTIDPKKFGILKSIPIISITPTSEDISNIVDPNIVTIQTGSNPLKPLEVLKIQKTKFITNLGAKVFFIFLLVSVSFTLYCLCFFGYSLEMLLPEINQLLSQIKPQSQKVFFILKRLSKIIYQYFQNLFRVIKTFLKNSKVINKYLNLISQKLFIILKICLKISQKIKKYLDYFFHQFFIFTKEHIKTPRRIKRYLIHKKYHFLILIFFSFIFSLFTKSVFATTDSITSSQNWVVPTGVSSIIIEAWGGGGAGGGLSADRVAGRGGGGAGGQYVKKTLTVTPGTTYPIIIGNGAVGSASSGVGGSDTTFNTAVVAKGGAGGQSYDSGTRLAGVGTTAGGIGDTIYKGGSGSNGATGTTAGGAGGGGAGTTGVGGNASGSTAGVGTTYYGGTGGAGLSSSGNGNPGNTYGGGGGAGASTVTNKTTNLNGGNGANGLVLITYTVANQKPSAPTLILPTNSDTGVTLTPTFQTVTTDPEPYYDNLQYKIILATDAAFTGTTQTFDQTVSNVGWSAQNVGTSAYSSGTTASYVLQIGLSYSTIYYWKAQAIDYDGTDTWSNLSIGYSFTTLNAPNNPPNQPTNSTPATGTTGVAINPTLTASAFSDNDGGDTQQASQWQISTDVGFSSIIWDSDTSGPASNSIGVSLVNMEDTFYFDGSDAGATDPDNYWTDDANAFDSDETPSTYARQGGSHTGTTEVGFLMAEGTNATFPPSTTINNVKVRIFTKAYSMAGHVSDIKATVFTDNLGESLGTVASIAWSDQTSIWSDYTTLSTPSGGWTVEKIQALETKIYGATYSTDTIDVYKVEILVNTTQAFSLDYSTQYYWKTRYQDNHGDWSNYSSPFSFTTQPLEPSPPNLPTLYLPTDAATNQSLTPTFKTAAIDINDDALQYELKICTDSDMTANCQTFDQTSSNVGWSGQDVGTSAYSSGTTATYVLQVGNSLAENTTYYWKTRAIDYAGSASWSSTQTTAFSFGTNSKPTTPTLSSPGTGTTAVSQTPQLKTVTTDPNTDPLQYKIELCTNEAMSTGCNTYDLTSSITGWSGQDVGTSAYASGTTATYTVQVGSSLAASTVYYWRSYAKDYSGTARWSATQGTAFSFTTVTPILTQATFRWSADDASGESRSGGVGDTWYDSNYDYRTPVTVTNNVGNTLSDFQVRLTIGTSALVAAGKMKSDCSDIQITDNDKQTSLNYYIEKNCNSPTDAVVWVKVPNLDASTTRDLYLYYGYSSAVTASDGDNTFAFFDDFVGTTLNPTKWNDWDPQSWSSVNISGGTMMIDLPATASWADRKFRGIISSSSFPFTQDGYYIESSSKWNIPKPANVCNESGKGIMITSSSNPGTFSRRSIASPLNCTYYTGTYTGNAYTFDFYHFGGYLGIDQRIFGIDIYVDNNIQGSIKESANYAAGLATPSNFIYERYRWHYNSADLLGSSYSANLGTGWTNPTWAQQSVTQLPLPSSSYFGIYGFVATSSINSWLSVDWFRIRKYAATEPTFSLGTETTEPPPSGPSGATWLAAENVGITGVNINSNIRLRFSVANTGVNISANYRLQVAPKGGSTNCTDVASGNFTDVTTTVGSNLAVMTTSPNFTNQEATTNQLTDSGTTFVAGKMVEYDSNQSDSITLSTNEFTEVEYNFQMTNNVGATTPYCFRVVDVGTTLNTYTNVAQLTTVYLENNVAPSAPYLPYVNNTTAQSGQQTPVYGLIDHTPAFSAIFDDPNTSNTAASYQLQIGSDSDWASAEIWDSTKTAVNGTCNENSRCADIVYSGGTSLVDGSTYYWRLKFWDNSDVGSSWSDTQQFSMNNAPSVSDVTINGNSNINLSENSSIGISWIATVTDADDYNNLSTATGKIYRSGVGQSCTQNNNNCYTDASCDFINCADDHCTALCSADIYFFTESTAIGSTYVDQYYQAWIEATDLRSEIGSSISTSTTIDVNNLSAFRIGSSLVYGEVFAGSDTGSSNTVTTVTNTGNALINLEITGDYMCTDYGDCFGQKIEPENQEYNLNTFTYGTGTTLSFSPIIVNIGISKPTQTPSNSSKNLYWGIGIPSSKVPGNYQGAVTILVD